VWLFINASVFGVIASVFGVNERQRRFFWNERVGPTGLDYRSFEVIAYFNF